MIFSTAYLPYLGGAELAVKEITDRISDCNFFLITARLNRTLPQEERIGNVQVYRVGFGIAVLDKLYLPFGGALRARQLSAVHRVRCFWSVMISYAGLAPFLLKLINLHRNIPILLTLQEGDSEAHISSSRFGLIGFFWRFALGRADRTQVISSYLGDMARHYGLEGKVFVIPNGVDLKKFKVESVKLKVSESDGKTIITVSRLVEKNGVDTLIRAFAEVKKQITDAQLIIAGDGPLRRDLQNLAYDLLMQDSIIFKGKVAFENIPDVLESADIFVRPSRSEGLGTAFLEAMAVGVPVIATPVGGIPDFLEDGKTGLFAKVDDLGDLADKICILLQNEPMRRELSSNARRMVETGYSWDSIARRMRELL